MTSSEPNKFDKPLAEFHKKDGTFISENKENPESEKED